VNAAAVASLALTVVYLAMVWLTTQVESVREASPWQNDPYDVVASLAPQVALVVGGLVGIRLVRYRGEPRTPAPVLRFQVRGEAVLVGLVTLTVVVDEVAWATDAAGDPSAPLAWVSRASLVVVALVLIPVLLMVGRAAASGAAGESDEPDPADSPDGLADAAALVDRAISGLARVAPTAGESLGREWSRLRRAAARIPAIDVRVHPWRVAGAIGLLAGTMLAIAHDLSEGMPSGGVGGVIVVWMVFVVVETMAVLAGFALLGRFLGIVGRRRVPPIE